MLGLPLLLVAGQLLVPPSDPPSSMPAPQSVGSAQPEEGARPAAVEQPAAADSVEENGPTSLQADPAVASEPETPDAENSPSVSGMEEETGIDPLTEPPAASSGDPAGTDPSPALALRSPCEATETARALRYGGLGVGAVSLLGAVAFAGISLYERFQAQELLDHSPAFGKIGDRYVQRDPAHPDVAAYDGHRATSSILSQLSWFALGLSLAGAGVTGAAFLLGEQADACHAS